MYAGRSEVEHHHSYAKEQARLLSRVWHGGRSAFGAEALFLFAELGSNHVLQVILHKSKESKIARLRRNILQLRWLYIVCPCPSSGFLPFPFLPIRSPLALRPQPLAPPQPAPSSPKLKPFTRASPPSSRSYASLRVVLTRRIFKDVPQLQLLIRLTVHVKVVPLNPEAGPRSQAKVVL